ncbi:MAG: GGDEF domain-containing protein [Butyrivibrio sp.]|nr:GGDEF domain-containing protein [Butyrivibrio sp.]
MPINKRPLKKSIFLGFSVFFVLLCFILSVLTYTTYTRSLYHSYEERMTDILNYVKNHIDIEDLSTCVETGEESEKYIELMNFMDGIMEDFDIHFLYIIRPLMGDNPGMMNVLSADTKYGREYEPDGYYLGSISYNDYDYEELKSYDSAISSNDGTYITFFKNFSVWGYDYTGLIPLVNSEGEKFAALCVDIEVSELRRNIQTYTVLNIILIAALAILFITFFLLWMNRNITEPISELEKSVVAFAKKSHDQKNPEELEYIPPEIHTHNEVESLSNAVVMMSADMREYVQNIIDAEGKVADMKNKVTHMDMVAYQDALTHVKNKAWYDKTKDRVDEDILSGFAAFGIVMVDLNCLKKINDNYGHDRGNDYIFGACHQICIIYDHSPVFRIGGDEFVVLLENKDFENRDTLFAQLKTAFELTSTDESKEPWERYSAACGMAIYDSSSDACLDDVFKKADALMYQDKLESKMGRE